MLKEKHPKTALARLRARLLATPSDLTEAREAAKGLLPFLPTPSVCDHMVLPAGVPMLGGPLFLPSPNPALRELPVALFKTFGLLDAATLPANWLPLYFDYQPRLHRAWWYRHLYSVCLQCTRKDKAPELAELDGVVAGLLFLALQPPVRSPLREALFKRLGHHKFGAFLAARGMLLAEEHLAILTLLGCDSRYLFWLNQMGWQEECPAYCVRRLDLYAGFVMLPTPLGNAWLEKLLCRAIDDPKAAAAALVLQPNAPEHLRDHWADAIIEVKSASCACLAARFGRHTLPHPKWKSLTDKLRPTAMFPASCWCEWHTHVSNPSEVETALADPQAPLLWCLDLLEATNASDKALRRRLLQAAPADEESSLALDWLNLRKQHEH